MSTQPVVSTQPTTAPATIVLPWTTPPLSLNDRYSRFDHARITAEVRRDTGWIVKARKVGQHEHVTVELRYQPKRRGRLDADNLVATLKPICDGIVDAGVVDDDTPQYMTKLMPTIVAATKTQRTGRLWLIITPGPAREA